MEIEEVPQIQVTDNWKAIDFKMAEDAVEDNKLFQVKL